MQANVVKMGFGRMALSPENGGNAKGLLKNLNYDLSKNSTTLLQP